MAKGKSSKAEKVDKTGKEANLGWVKDVSSKGTEGEILGLNNISFSLPRKKLNISISSDAFRLLAPADGSVEKEASNSTITK